MNSNGGSSFFGSDWLGAFLIIAILFGGGIGGFGGRGYGPGPDVATKEFVQDSVNNQAVQTGLRDILLSSANNNYETAQLINGQTSALMQQQYTHQIENDQRFFALQQQVSQLGYQMDQCCCSIKTQMLQDKYDETVRELAKAQNEAINAQQSAYLLSVMGKWIANPAATTA
jgi:hypothetical protein